MAEVGDPHTCSICGSDPYPNAIRLFQHFYTQHDKYVEPGWWQERWRLIRVVNERIHRMTFEAKQRRTANGGDGAERTIPKELRDLFG